MNRKVLGLIAVVAVILIVLFSLRGFNDGDKEKKVVVNVPDAKEQQEAVTSVDDKEEIAESDKVKEDETFVSAGVEEIQQLKEEAGKENPLTEEEMIKIAQEQVENFYSFSVVDSEEELKVLAKKFYYYYNEDSFKNAKTYYEPNTNRNLKLAFEEETVTKNGKDTFTYVGIVESSTENIKTNAIDTFKQHMTIDLMKGENGDYKIVSQDFYSVKK
ncbi:hypothetical protein NST68_30710 [Paenibacillus sp. FSL E2-0230]|uniref:hypothetical protein n=1 Tax=Paenibacillus sp. FSL E2-0230 TaxID=2954727 RepID=UPI0030D36EED